MKKLFIYAVCLVALSACHSKPIVKKTTDSVAVYRVPDEKAIDKAVQGAYASLYFKKGGQPDYKGIKKWFIPKAQLISFGADSAQIMTIDQFIYLYRTKVEADTIKGLGEKEIYGKTERFGRIASRISSYVTEIIHTDTIYQRGVNSFQLIKTNDGWKVSSIIWDEEKSNDSIPGYYLGK